MESKSFMGQPARNPFKPETQILDGAEFVGREEARDWLQANLVGATAKSPLALSGASGIGKTSFLKQLETRRWAEAPFAVYTDFASLNLSNASGFLWDLAKAMMNSMASQELAGPTIEKRMLVLNPQLVFKQRFWQPLTSLKLDRQLVLAWDNFDTLAERPKGNPNIQAFRAYLYGLLDQDLPLRILVTITPRLEAMADNSLAPFHLESSHRLARLDHDQTNQLVELFDQMAAYRPIGDLVHILTAGHPGDIQRLCYTLFERQQRRDHRQVTTADILAVLESDLSPRDFYGPVYRRLARANFTAERAAN